MAAPKIWHSLSNDVDKIYLACLYNADVLFEKGLGSIDHGRPQKYYKCLMAADFEGAANAWWVRRQTLKLDVEEEVLALEDAPAQLDLIDDDVEETQ